MKKTYDKELIKMTRKRKPSLVASNASDLSHASNQNTTASRISSPGSSQNLSATVTQESSPAIVQNSQEFIEENLKEALLDWLKEQPFYQSKQSDEKGVQEKAVKNLADGLISIIYETPPSDDIDPVLLEEIKKHVQKFPIDPKQKSNQQLVDDLPTHILDHLKSLQVFQDISLRRDRSVKKSTNVKKKAAVLMLEDIANWVENLPIETSSPEEDENLKDQLESSLIHKIGELNMNSEIFNDDFIYDDILGDEIEILLENVSGENIKNNITPLKRELLAIVKKARKKIREENEGQMYKQQLYETISKTLPTFDLSIEGKASFEVLKDNLTDAFISMHYVNNDACLVSKLRKRINDEIYKFCNSYLKRCPASPIDTSKLNQALFNALKNVTEPQNESFRDDVELVKIKDVINDWAKELPLKSQMGQEKLHTNKMITVLAKKIHDIENEKELIPAEEYEEKTKKEIVKFLKKVAMTTDNDDDIKELVDNLIKVLRDTEETRKLNASIQPKLCCLPLAKGPSKARLGISFNDASVSPCPINTCSQTSNCSKSLGRAQNLVQKCSSVQTPCKKMQAIGSQIEVTPNVIVNEYHWDSIDESCIQTPRVSCTCPAASHPPFTIMPQPMQSPVSPRGDEICIQPPRPPCAGVAAPRSMYETILQPQRTRSPTPRQERECTPAALKSCIVSRPFPMEPFQNKFNKPRDQDQANKCSCGQHQVRPPTSCSPPDYNYDNYDYQLPENPAPPQFRYESDRTQSERRNSNQSFGSVLEENNSFQIGNQYPATGQLSQTSSPSSPYPYHLSTEPVPNIHETSLKMNRSDDQNKQYPRQPCSCRSSHEATEQRNLQETQYVPYTASPGSPHSQNRSCQDNQPVTPSPYIMSPCPLQYSQGQSNMTPRSSISISSPLQMPCSFNPRSPCCIRPEPPASSEEYDLGLGCAFQNSSTRLGNFNDEEQQLCMPRYPEWSKVRDDFEYWETDRQNFSPIGASNRRDGRRCKACKHRCGEQNGRR